MIAAMSSDERTRIQSGIVQATIGTQLSGIYELDEHLGSGGMAEVYRGHNIQTGDHVAVKIVLPEFMRDETILALFRKEASILNHLSHDAIVRYHVFTIDPGIGRPYLAMEFVDGQPLSDVLRKGPMPAEEVRRLCIRLAGGLAAAHEAQVFHRDLSPDNIILPGARVDRAKIIDFGIARSNHGGEGTLIGGRFAGKYGYVSPEQLGLFGGEVNAQSDIYSLGLVLAAALRGKPIDMSGSQWEVVEKRRTVPDLGEIEESMHPLLEAMLQPDPQNRPASMDQVIEIARSTGSSTAGPSEVGPAIDEPRSFVEYRPPPSIPHRTAPAGTTRGRNIALASLAAFVAAGLGTAVFLFGLPWDAEERVDDAGPVIDPPPFEVVIEDPPPTEIADDDPPAVEIASDDPAPVEEVVETTEAEEQTEEIASTAPIDEIEFPPEVQIAEPEAPLSDEPETPATYLEREIVDRLLEQAGDTERAEEVQPPDQLALDLSRPDPLPEIAIPSTTKTGWLRDFQGGDCFFATILTETEAVVEIEGFGADIGPFERMLDAFETEFGREPEIHVRPITEQQCPVADFLRGLGESSGDAPSLVLQRSILAHGDRLTGHVIFPDNSRPHLLLIDAAGNMSNLDVHLASGTRTSFSIPIELGEGDQQGAFLIVALAADRPIAMSVFSNAPAANLLPDILTEIRSRAIETGASAKYFRIGG
jgi:serine/threonine-protein kinase